MNKEIFSHFEERGHEQISFFYCPVTKLKAIVAIHNTVLGPSLGGCRMKLYDSEEQAIEDVARLAEGMTYKSSIAGMDLGGGKACIIADNKMTEGRVELFTQFGKYLNRLSGKYYTAEDMGTKVSDMRVIKSQTPYCVGFPIEDGGSGDPSPWTAMGVFKSMTVFADEVLKKDLSELKVAVEGVGNVGYSLVRSLVNAGAKVTVSDINNESTARAKKELGVEVVDPKNIYNVDCDIFSPCAIGQTINTDTLKVLKAKTILGAANNQLKDKSIYKILEDKKIIYCPDFVVNAGGVISVGAELVEGGWKQEWVINKVQNIAKTLIEVIKRSEQENKFSEEIALTMAKERIARKANSANSISC